MLGQSERGLGGDVFSRVVFRVLAKIEIS